MYAVDVLYVLYAHSLKNPNACTYSQHIKQEVESVMDAKEYRAALARTRQAVFVNKAVAFMNAGNPTRYGFWCICVVPHALLYWMHNRCTYTMMIIIITSTHGIRAVVELKLALQENAIVREPLITNRLEKQDVC